jgi:hypothetical protein
MTDPPAEQPRERIVDKTAEMEREFVDGLVERNAARWEKRKRGIDADRRARRGEMSVLELCRLAIERQAKISAVPAGNVEPSRGGSERAGPPAQQLLDDDPMWRNHWTVIRSRLERVHEKLDEAEGLGPVAATTTMLAEEKDKRILGEEGLEPLDVVEKLGRDIAGSPETVRRVRRAAGRSAKDGRRIDPAAPTPSVRRVVIMGPVQGPV